MSFAQPIPAHGGTARTVTQTLASEAATPTGKYGIRILASIFQIDRAAGIVAQAYPDAAATSTTAHSSGVTPGNSAGGSCSRRAASLPEEPVGC